MEAVRGEGSLLYHGTASEWLRFLPDAAWVGEKSATALSTSAHGPRISDMIRKPAGRVLDGALAEAGIHRRDVYVTNVVKHFKWEAAQRGKRRIHKKPRYSEIHACRPWLDAEIELVKPHVLVCLGATAAQSLLCREFSVNRQHGEVVASPLAPVVMATIHPSAILRSPDSESRRQQMRLFVADLRKAGQLANRSSRRKSAA